MKWTQTKHLYSLHFSDILKCFLFIYLFIYIRALTIIDMDSIQA